MGMNELHSPGTEPSLWLPFLHLSHKACLGNRVPGSKGTEGSALAGRAKEVPCEAGHEAGTLHEMTAKPLAPLGSVVESLGALRWELPVTWQGVAQGP